MALTVKKILVLWFLICAGESVYCQSLSMDVMASSGSIFTDEEFSLSWTIGENFIETFEIGGTFQTLGFHQGNIDDEHLKLETEGTSTWFYPNPVTNILTIHSNEIIGEAVVKVSAMTGETVYEQKITMKTHCVLNFSFLAKGTYYLQLINDKPEGHLFIKL